MDLISIGMALAFLLTPPSIPDPGERDIDQFPQTIVFLGQEIQRADDFKDYLERVAELDRANADRIEEMLTEISRRRDLYSQLRWLKHPPTTGEYQIRMLRIFRTQLGWHDYARGVLPPIVPLEYYRKVP